MKMKQMTIQHLQQLVLKLAKLKTSKQAAEIFRMRDQRSTRLVNFGN